ncbi:winged helix-turn-helix transcriptional regulator [Clostridium sp. cel8]|uniref:metalloregulator ArsR/SmtB family transcription factor n=1 Tax=Clostridium sp. cel8 TaxID=2663123 RepID=UPI0015F69FB0|nr:winged helix-turn-helix transcriptional regulator [Clostridium sp. cel8]
MDKNFKKYSQKAEILKALAHPVRLCIVRGLIEKGKCNVNYMQSCLDIPQSTLSQHIQKLRTAGIIEGKRNGLEINYSVSNQMVVRLIKVLFD